MNGYIITIECLYGEYWCTYICKVIDADHGLKEVETTQVKKKSEAEQWAKDKAALYGAPIRRKTGSYLYEYKF